MLVIILYNYAGFTNLELRDQMNLLQSTWLDILCLNVAYRSSPYKGVLVYADDLKLTTDDAAKYSMHVEVDAMARRLARKLTELEITKEEFLIVKAMLLVNPGKQLPCVFDRVLCSTVQLKCIWR